MQSRGQQDASEDEGPCLASNSKRFVCVCLPSLGIRGVGHHAQLPSSEGNRDRRSLGLSDSWSNQDNGSSQTGERLCLEYAENDS